MVGELTAVTLPESSVDAGRRHAAGADSECVGDRAGQGMAHTHLPGLSASGVYPQVSAAVDGTASVAAEPVREEVGGPSLDGAPEV